MNHIAPVVLRTRIVHDLPEKRPILKTGPPDRAVTFTRTRRPEIETICFPGGNDDANHDVFRSGGHRALAAICRVLQPFGPNRSRPGAARRASTRSGCKRAACEWTDRRRSLLRWRSRMRRHAGDERLPLLPRARLPELLGAVPCSARLRVSAGWPAGGGAISLHLQRPRRLLLFAVWRNRTRSRSAGSAGMFPLASPACVVC